MLKRMLNVPEEITYRRLGEVCARRSARVYAKVRLADVLPIEGSGLPDGSYEFALQAHYDFVITDLAQNPLFAVEFDGPGHRDGVQADRDARKDGLSRRFHFPLMRIHAEDLRRSESRLDRLTEVADRWFDGDGPGSVNRTPTVGGPTVSPHARGRVVAEKPPCPLCGSPTVARNGRYGPFLGCVRFPECRGARDLPTAMPSVPPQAVQEPESTVVSMPRRWFIASGVLILLIFSSLVAIILLSSREIPRDAVPVPGIPEVDPAPRAPDVEPATDRQKVLLGLLIGRRGWETGERDAEIERVLGYKRPYQELSKREASRLITAWDDRKK